MKNANQKQNQHTYKQVQATLIGREEGKEMKHPFRAGVQMFFACLTPHCSRSLVTYAITRANSSARVTRISLHRAQTI